MTDITDIKKESPFWKRLLFVLILVLLPLAFIAVSMAIGSYHTSPADIIRIFLGKITGEDMGVDPRTTNLF